MYETFTIRDFRGFKELRLEDLARVNLIIGRNNVGKTGVLEAMFLHSGWDNPSLPTVVENIRGRSRFALDPRAIWGWLFPERDADKTIDLIGTHVGGRGTHRLRLRLCSKSAGVGDLTRGEERGAVSAREGALLPELVLEYADPGGQCTISRAYIEKDALKTEPATPRRKAECIYLSARARVDSDTAERYTKADDLGKMPELVELLRGVDKRLMRLSLGYENEQPVIKADMGLSQPLPVAVVGEGFNRLLQILLAIATCEGGLVLVDEVENGIHWSALQSVWKGIFLLARKLNVQIVGTTHSGECIAAAVQMAPKDEPGAFAVYRLDRVDADVRAVRYAAEHVTTATEMDLEIRG